MTITQVKIRRIYDNSRVKALASITIDHMFAVHDLKIIAGDNRLFLAMPYRKGADGLFRDIVHPITPECRHTIEETVLAAYQRYLEEHPLSSI